MTRHNPTFPWSLNCRRQSTDRLDLAEYHAYHATRADLLRRLGRSADARAAYEKAIELAGNSAEVAYLLAGATSSGPTEPA